MVGGEGDDQLRGSGRGAIAGCHCRVLLEGRVTTNFGGVDVVPLLVPSYGAIVYYGWGRVTTNSGRGAIAGCHCRVPL